MVNLLPDIRLAQSILKRKFPSVGKPLRKPLQKQSKRAFEKYKPHGIFSEFYGTHTQLHLNTPLDFLCLWLNYNFVRITV